MSEQTKHEINVSGLHEELERAGLLVQGVDSNGKVTFARALSGQETATAAQVTAKHKGKPARIEQLQAAGVTLEAMLQALWEKTFLGTDTKAQVLLQKMAAIEIEE
jgi:hypothetical protein